MEKVNLAQKFARFQQCWSPKIAGELNDSYVKLAKLEGEFVWHRHENEDELFLVVNGTLRMKIRENGAESEITIAPGEFLIVPRGVEHLPIADQRVEVVLLEPKSTLNTGDIRNERTLDSLEWI
jgi:mannose-6-phosphate isomerase-like protein (cupin superfamily)